MENKKLNNKGFSLVELIIVIAIMAILVGVLAPQYIKYVERSRKSTDVQTLASMHDALSTLVMDPAYATEVNGTSGSTAFTVTLNKGAAATYNLGSSQISSEFIAIIGQAANVVGKSNACSGVQVVYDATTDKVYYRTNGGTAFNDLTVLTDSGTLQSGYTFTP